jgi:alpha/beta superfamily hydrolase
VSDDSGRDLHLPVDGLAAAAAIVLHPHPAMGGDRHHPLVVAVSAGLASAGVAALRIDLTDPDVAVSALRLADIAADLLTEIGGDRLVLVGYSWGSLVAATAAPAGLTGRVLVAPPLSMVELPRPTASVPSLVLVPAHDQYGSPDAVRAATAGWPDTTIEDIDGCDHFLAGAVARIAARAVAWTGNQI